MNFGKQIGSRTWLHVSALGLLPADKQQRFEIACSLAAQHPGESFNVVKFEEADAGVSLLDYPGFFDEGFPVLRRYWTVDVVTGRVRYRSFEDSLNPPILHRKELLLAPEDARRQVYAELTAAAEQVGLFDDPVRIGFQRAWEKLLACRGYRVVGHDLVPLANDESTLDTGDGDLAFDGVARHRTALVRYGLSAPIQTLARFGQLDGSRSVFDYGCGRGDDVRYLQENGIPTACWDPYFAPHEAKSPATIVNIGFVINVIEDPQERRDALLGAWALAGELLVVSAMLANQEAVKGTPYGDGVLTARNTFQKYYTQGELKQFIAEVLDEEPIPVGPGIFYVFKDKDAEQRFMYGRQTNRRNVLRLSQLSRPAKPERIDRAQANYEQHREMLEALWGSCLALGREPDRSEVPNLAAITESLGSLPAALRFIRSRKDNAEAVLEQARRSRIDDLRVYFAQLQFDKRKAYSHLEARLQKDVKAFFGDYRAAVDAGRALLFQIAQIEAISDACQQAAERGIGWLEEGESLQLHTTMVEQLPPILRAYISCGTALYGDVSSADLIKIHIRSGKLTLMSFDDFINKPLPRMVQRVKLNLRQQDLALFDYVDPYEPPYLYRKSRFINEEYPRYAEQTAFEAGLESLGLFDFNGYGPPPQEFDGKLAQRRYQVDGFRLVRSQSIPDLDAPCGQYLTYRQLIECGETQARTELSNQPTQPQSYTALLELAVNVLDPVIDYYGMIKLTYGFCSPELARHIPGRIAPKLDQHAAYELNRLSQPICSRLGAAVDFLVEDEDMIEVGKWVAENVPFDRMYLYGPDQPLHISYGPEMLRQVTLMLPRDGQKALVPKTVALDALRRLTWQELLKPRKGG